MKELPITTGAGRHLLISWYSMRINISLLRFMSQKEQTLENVVWRVFLVESEASCSKTANNDSNEWLWLLSNDFTGKDSQDVLENNLKRNFAGSAGNKSMKLITFSSLPVAGICCLVEMGTRDVHQQKGCRTMYWKKVEGTPRIVLEMFLKAYQALVLEWVRTKEGRSSNKQLYVNLEGDVDYSF